MDKKLPSFGVYGIQDIEDKGYPFLSHDHAVALMNNGKVEKYIENERITRKRYDNNLHKNLFSLLKKAKLLSKNKFDIIITDNVIGRSFISENGSIRIEGSHINSLLPAPEKAHAWWVDNVQDAYIINHELAHIFSNLPFYGKFKENSLLVHFDGGASKSNVSAWLYNNNTITNIEYHWKFKYLTSLFNANALSFAIAGVSRKNQNAAPGKIMALAAFGKHSQKMEEWLKENYFFENIWGNKSLFFNKAKKDWGITINDFDTKNHFIHNICATMQHIFIRDFTTYLKTLQANTQTEYLYFAGGCALSIVLNTEICDQKIFKKIFIPPCTNDSGLALGAASALEWTKHNKIHIHPPYLNNWGIENYTANYSENDIINTAKLLLQNKVIGICNENGESGPRALGNRSIIALANQKEIANRVSCECKKREWYRPVAPIMLQKNLPYFAIENGNEHLAKYMLLEYTIKESKRKEIEGCVHIDGSARIQTIETKSDNPFMFDLLSYLNDTYNIKALINTSFNRQGESIVHTIDDAEKAAKEMNLDGIVLNGKLKTTQNL